jgi:hypothetical protein
VTLKGYHGKYAENVFLRVLLFGDGRLRNRRQRRPNVARRGQLDVFGHGNQGEAALASHAVLAIAVAANEPAAAQPVPGGHHRRLRDTMFSLGSIRKMHHEVDGSVVFVIVIVECVVTVVGPVGVVLVGGQLQRTHQGTEDGAI